MTAGAVAAAALAEAAGDNDNELSEWVTATSSRYGVPALAKPTGAGQAAGGVVRLTVRRGIMPDANAPEGFEALKVNNGVPHAAACVIPGVIPNIVADTARGSLRDNPKTDV